MSTTTTLPSASTVTASRYGARELEPLRPEVEQIVARYERKPAAILPVLHLVQQRLGSVSTAAEAWVADVLGISVAHVHEVVTFYTLYHRQPVGTYHFQVCANVSCMLRGGELDR